ncbi:MAG: T9SS type A sorting domain-containing protein [Bacteroidota bacterium]
MKKAQVITQKTPLITFPKLLAVIMLLLLNTTVTSFAANLYWVGGTGNWNDNANHWRTASGGTIVAAIPTAADNVFFDGNSFSATGQTVTINVGATCNDMNWSGAQYTPTLAGTLALSIAGSLTFISSMKLTYSGDMTLSATTTGKTVTTNGIVLKGRLYFGNANGGEWTLQDSVTSINRIDHTGGTLNTNNKKITCLRFGEGGTFTRVLNLGSSIITLSYSGLVFWVNNANFSINPGTSTFRFTAADSARIQISSTINLAVQLNNIEWVNASCYGTIDNQSTFSFTANNITWGGNGRVTGTNTFNGSMSMAAGKTYTFTSGKTQTFGSSGTMISNGTCGNPVTINASTAGSAAIIRKLSGTITLNSAILKDNTASGGATFNANSSMNSGNVSGWSFISPITSLYWVNGSGNWNASGHWSTSSGGMACGFLPSAGVDVYFDANSFTGSGQIVTINVAAVCLSMDWTGALFSPILAGNSTLSIAGSLTFINAMSLTYSGITTLTATSTGKTISTNGIQFKGQLIFGSAAGGGWNLLDDLSSTARIDLKGTLNTNDKTVTCSMFVSNAAPPRVLNPGSSTFIITGSGPALSIVNYGGSTFTIGTNTSTVLFTAADSARFYYGHAANCPNFNNIEWTNPLCKGSIDNQSGYQLSFNKVSLAGNGIINGNNTFKGSLTLAGGKNYTFQSGKTQTFGINGTIVAVSSCTAPVLITAATAGSAAVFSKSSGNITLGYCSIKDITATGGAIFTATNSVGSGIVTGWDIPNSGLYWVGGSGNWSDPAHWSLCSGVSSNGTAGIPSPDSPVFFDANSFTNTGQTVTINVAASCKDMNWSGSQYLPTLAGTSALSIAGSLKFINAMNLTYSGDITLSATTTGKTVTTNGIVLNGRLYFGNANGGEWTLQDSVTSINRIDHSGGTLNTNNNKISCTRFGESGTFTRVLNLGSSILTLSSTVLPFWVLNANCIVNPGTSTFRFTAADSARILISSNTTSAVQFNNLEWVNASCLGAIDNQSAYTFTANNVTWSGNGNVTGTNTFNGIMSLAAGKTYTFTSGKTQTFGSLGTIVSNGTCSSLVTINASTAGSAAIFSKSSGSNITIYNVALEDNTAVGGSTFSAINSFNNGNVTGWNIPLVIPVTELYWIGGNGNWNNPANWSCTSGGPANTCGLIPTHVIKAIFDDTGFHTNNDTVTIDVNANCDNMIWNTTSQPVLKSTGANTLSIYGNLQLAAGMTNNFTNLITLAATTTGKTITTNGFQFKGQLIFGNAAGGGWNLLDDLSSTARIDLRGTLNTNDKTVTCSMFVSNAAPPRVLNPGSSTFIITGSGPALSIVNYGGSTFTLGVNTSTIRFTAADSASFFYGHAANCPNFNNIEWTSSLCKGIIDNQSGYQLSFNNVSFAGNGATNGSNTFNGNLTLAGGKTYTFQSGKTQTFGSAGGIVSNGYCNTITSLASSVAGSAATLSKSVGPLTIWWATIKDIVAGGSLPFSANYSTVSGVSSGWTTPMNSTVSVVAVPSNIICQGDVVSFTANYSNGGTNPAFSWFINGIDQNVNSSTFVPTGITNNAVVQCSMVPNLGCGVPTTTLSNTIIMNVVQTTVAPAVTISASPAGTICYSTPVTFTASTATGGTSPVFKWMVGADTVGTGSTYIANTLTNGKLVKCIMVSSLPCASTPVAVSNTITMSVTSSVAPILRIYTSPECLKDTIRICPNTSVTFFANLQNAGTAPSFIWEKNGVVVGNSIGTYITAALSDDDIVSCMMISNATCAIPATVPAVYNVNVQVHNKPPAIQIVQSPEGTHVCSSEIKEFYATFDYGGTSLPTFTWYRNGTSFSGYSYPPVWSALSSFSNNDQITCVLTTNTGCASVTTATSNKITMTVSPPYSQPVISIIQEFPDPGPVCDATPVFFRAHNDYAGYYPPYQWYNKGVPINGATSHVYYLYYPQDGDSIYCRLISNSTCTNIVTATSNGIRLTVLKRPIIASDPSNSSICAGSNATFAVNAIGGPPLSYQWQISTNSVDWSNQLNNSFYTGMTTATMQITGATAGMHDLRYRCCVSNGFCSVNSSIAKLSVVQSVSITNPIPVSLCEGATASYSVSQISGETQINYSWQLSTDGGTTWNNQENSAIYSGMHSNNMSINTVTGGMNNLQFRCKTSGAYCSAVSGAAVLTVNIPAPAGISITSFPSQMICQGTDVVFTAVPVNGGTPVYQWYLNNAAVGSNSNTWSSSSLITGDQVKCTLHSNALCATLTTATSNPIQITMGKTMFWISGSGRWDDNMHWSFDSLPPRNPNPTGCIPDSTTDVYFDQYSGFAPEDTVTVSNIPAKCKSMDWSGSQNHPAFNFNLSTLSVFGNLKFIDDMDVDTMAVIWFSSDEAGRTITVGGANVNFIGFQGIGAWTMLDSISAKTLQLTHGSLNTNNQTITAQTMALWPENTLSTVDLGSSKLNIGANFTFGPDFLDLDADSSYIYFTEPDNVFLGWSDSGYIKNIRFNDVIFQNASLSYPKQFGSFSFDTVIFRSDGNLEGNSSFNNLLLSGGRTYTFVSGCTDTIWNTWSLPSSNGNRIILQSSDSGSMAGIYKPHHCAVADWLMVYDIEVMGGANFYAGPAAHSYLRNSPGWILDTMDTHSPWKGISNDWNDPLNWNLQGALPNYSTNVSFSTCGLRNALISAPGAFCDTLKLGPGTSLTVLGSNTLDVYGDWVDNGTFQSGAGTVGFFGTEQQTIFGNSNFNNLLVDDSNGLIVNDNPGVSDSLTLVNGEVYSSDGLYLRSGSTIIRYNGSLETEPYFVGTANVVYKEPVTTGPEIPRSPGVLSNLTIDAGATNAVSLASIAYIDSSLVFFSGIINSDDFNFPMLSSMAMASGASDSSFVNGPIAKIGDSAFVFPIGDVNGTKYIWAPISTGISTNPSNTFKVQYHFEKPANSDSAFMCCGLIGIDTTEYWDFDRVAGSEYPDIALYWKDSVRSGIASLASTCIASWQNCNGTVKWVNKNGTAISNNDVTGLVTSSEFYGDPEFIGGTLAIGFKGNSQAPATVTITASPTGKICSGTSVAFTATPLNEGSNPSYHWFVNGMDMNENSPSYSSIFNDGDIITCSLIPGGYCTSHDTAISNADTIRIGNTMFWISGSGDWNDNNHWSYDSLPPRNPNPSGCIPGPATDVYFDQFSGFTPTSKTVSITADSVACRNMDWTGSQNNPMLDILSGDISVYGSLKFIDQMQGNLIGSVTFKSPDSGQIITTAGKQFNNVYFRGNGGWILADSLSCSDVLQVNQGYLNTNGQTIIGKNIHLWPSSPTGATVDLGTSTIKVGEYFQFETDFLTLDADSSKFYLSNHAYFEGFSNSNSVKDFRFKDLYFEMGYLIYEKQSGSLYFDTVHFNSDGIIDGNHTFSHLLLSAGSTYEFKSGCTDTILQTWSLPSTPGHPIRLISSIYGVQAGIYKPDHCVPGDWLQVSDIVAAGGASYYAGPPAHSSVTNSPGWILDSLHSNSPWKGISNDWNDPTNWNLQGALPNYNTNVSLATCGLRDAVINGPGAYCDTLILNPGTSLSISGKNSLSVYGDWIDNGTFQSGAGTVGFLGTEQQTIIGNSNFNNLLVNNSNGIVVNDNPSVSDSLTLVYGEVYSSDSLYLNSGVTIVRFNGSLEKEPDFGGTADVVYKKPVTSGPEIPSAPGVLANLTIDAGPSNIVTLASFAYIDSSLVFLSGIIKSDSINFPTLSGSATTSGASDSSFVDGPVAKSGVAAFVFPTGDVNGTNYVWAPISTGVSTNPSNTFKVQYHFEKPANSDSASIRCGLIGIDTTEYWDFNRVAGSEYPDIALYWKDSIRSGITSLNNTSIASWQNCNGVNAWVNKHGTATSNNDGTGLVSSSEFISDPNFTGGMLTLGFEDTTQIPSVTIAASPGDTCVQTQQSHVFLTATPLNQGTNTMYKYWVNNHLYCYSPLPTWDYWLSNGDVIICVMITTDACNNTFSYSSNTITVTFNTPVLPTDSISASPGENICDGAEAIFTAHPVNGGDNPIFHWMYNGVYVGTNSPTWSSTSLENSDRIECLMTSSASCIIRADVWSNTIYMTVNQPVAPLVSISASPAGTICAGTDVKFTATPTNEGTNPVYRWFVNGTDMGVDSTVFNSSTLSDDDVISCVLTSNYSCASQSTATSNQITIVIPGTMFWIGGSGNWDDNMHWSFDSLPPRFPNPSGCIPTRNTDVYFDQYSGFASGDSVTIVNMDAECKSMDWSGSQNNPSFNFVWRALYVYGDLRFINDMDVDTLALILFSSDETGRTITFAGARANFIGFQGNGAWALLDSIAANTMQLTNGSLNTNDHSISAENLNFIPTTPLSLIDLGSSQLKIGSGVSFNTEFLNLDADSSVIVFTKPNCGIFGYHFVDTTVKPIRLNDVYFHQTGFIESYSFFNQRETNLSFDTVKFNSDAYFSGPLSFNHLLLAAGSTNTFTSAYTDTIWNTWSLPSSNGNQIILKSSDSGSIAGIYKPHHCAVADWLQVYDIEVMGGATFYAGVPAHSYLRNSPGWVLDTLDSPWVGNSSDWNTSDNWDLNGTIPNITTNVRLTSCGLHDAVISNAGAYCDTLILDPGTSLTILGSNTLDVYGDWVANGSFTCNTSTVNFKGNSTLYGSYPLQFYNVGVDAGSRLALNTGYGIKIGGDFLNGGKFSPNEGKITFNGNGQQEIRMNGDSLYDVEFSNTRQGAGFDDFILYDDVSVTHDATLNTGVIQSASGADFIITDGALCNEGSNLSYIDGRVIKHGTSAFIFPTGDSAIWAPAGIAAPASSSEISAQYFFALPPDTGLLHMNTGMIGVSNNEWWNLESDNAYPNVTLYWKNGPRSGISSTAGLEFGHLEDISGSNKWTARTGVISGTSDNGSISSMGMLSYSPMTFGKGLSNPLPVNLISFDASCVNGMTWLRWSTASENNSNHFIVERSTDILQWKEIASINAAGNSNERRNYEFTDDEPLNEINYYQLKQVDYDGAATLYGPVSVHCRTEGTLVNVYPNPFSGIINIEYLSDTPEGFTVVVLDVTGREVYRTEMIAGIHQNFTIDLSNLTLGIYYLDLKTANNSRYLKIVRE